MAHNIKKKDNVEGIYGGPVITPKPHEGCIEVLEELLEAARSGEIVGLVGAVMHGDSTTSIRMIGLSSRATIGAVAVVLDRLVKDD